MYSKCGYLLKPLICGDHCRAWVEGHEVANEADAVADGVLALRVSPHSPPSAPLVDAAVTANYKAVAKVTPFLKWQFRD